jgi:opacity protein-like surface antigen
MAIIRRWVHEVLLLVMAVLALTQLVAAPAAGVGTLYISGDLGISAANADASGTNLRSGLDVSGGDDDSSPRYGGALGVEWPLDQSVPWEIGLPSWDTRFEFELIGGRSYEFKTPGGFQYNSEVTSWSMMTNLWLDIPVHRPIEALFGRIPILEPLSINVGTGIGIAKTDMSVTDSESIGATDDTKFAWQVGVGIGYAITEQVSFNIGYRYFDLGKVTSELTTVGVPNGSYSLDMGANELSASLRVNFYALP